MLKDAERRELHEPEEELYDEEITQAGFRKRSRSLLQRAGVLPTRPEDLTTTPAPTEASDTTPAAEVVIDPEALAEAEGMIVALQLC